jgi:hypothetical protein
MKWLVDWFLSFRPWLVIVTRDGEKPEIFGEYWRESEASRTRDIAAGSRGFSDAPPPSYRVTTRKSWNAQQKYG